MVWVQVSNCKKKFSFGKEKHFIHKTPSTRDSPTLASRSYKQTMNAFINKYKFNQQSKLRKMQKGQPRIYWNFLNSLKNRKKSDGPPLKEFYAHFKEIYSDNPIDDNHDSNFSNMSFTECNDYLNRPFTCEEIDQCIKRLKNNKTPGGDEILNEYLKLTRHFMPSVYESLFNLILKTGHVPEQWLIGKIIPIFKNKGDPKDPNNYRPITILRCLGKLFTAVLNDRLCNFLEYNEMLLENQARFRKHYSTTDHIFTLHSLIELLKYEKKKKLFCCFVDFSKAFDSVWGVGLWRKLLSTEVTGNFLRVLQNMHANIKSCVTVNGQDFHFLQVIAE